VHKKIPFSILHSVQFIRADCHNFVALSSFVVHWKVLSKENKRKTTTTCFSCLDIEDKNDYETNLAEDDSIEKLLVVPQTSTAEAPRRIIAMSLGSRKEKRATNDKNLVFVFVGEPNWMRDYQQWNVDSGYFAGRIENNFEWIFIQFSF